MFPILALFAFFVLRDVLKRSKGRLERQRNAGGGSDQSRNGGAIPRSSGVAATPLGAARPRMPR